MQTPLGTKISILQAEHNLTNQALAEKMGIYPSNLAKLKTVKRPRPQTLHKLSKALGVPVRIFFEEALLTQGE